VCVRYGQGKTIASLRCFWEFAFVSDSNHLCHNFLSLCFCLSEYSFLGVFDVFLFQEFTHTDSFQFWLLTGNGKLPECHFVCVTDSEVFPGELNDIILSENSLNVATQVVTEM